MDAWTSTNKLPERLPFTKKRLPKKVILSYILDYVIIVVLILAFTIIDKVEPFHQPWSMKNYTLHYPYAVHERIPVPQLVVIVVGGPAVIIGIYTLVIDGLFSHQGPVTYGGGRGRKLLGRYRLKDRLWELNCGILGLMLSVCAAFTITGALKNAIGKPRPDLVDRCKVKAGYTESPFNLTTYDVCTQTDNHILKDGFRSFPSGHSSTAFAGLYYLSLYLAAKLHVLDAKGEVWKSFIVLIPTLAASLVAGSRIMDARHHPFDVLSGSALGILVAWGSYRQYFPPVTETWKKGRAHPIRTWGREPVAPPTIRIDEDTEPLRPIEPPRDVERGTASGFSAPPVSGGIDGRGDNVFRQQVSETQRRRQQETYGNPAAFGVQRGDTSSSTASLPTARLQGSSPAPNPFHGEPGRRRTDDEYGYSSSDDDGQQGYELEETYTLSAPQSGVYNPVSGQFTDTGYHPGVSPIPSTSNTPVGGRAEGVTSSDIADTKREVPMSPARQHPPGAL